jgi:hypothetical protein
VHTSEISNANGVNPSFQPLKIKGQKLCNSDPNLQIMVKFINKQENVKHLIGVARFTLNDLRDKRQIPVQDERTQNAAGQLIIEHFEVLEMPSFLSYLNAGWGISLALALDFTGSNGSPQFPSSLHFLGANN